MPFLLLAQEAPQAGEAAGRVQDTPFRWESLLEAPTVIFGHSWPHAPVVAIPVFVVALFVVSFVVEKIASFVVRRLTARTDTQLDDVFVASLPGLIRTFLLFLGLWVIAHALVKSEDLLTNCDHAVQAGGVLVLGIVLVRMALRMTDAWAVAKEHRRPIGPGIKLGIKVAALPILFVSTLHAMGVEIAPLIGVLGVGSLAVALALQDVLKNIFCGLQLVVDQPIRAGDFVLLDDGTVKGTVIEVGLRSTKLRTVQNNVIIIPNATVAGATITNTDVVDRSYTHVVNVGVAYGSDTRKVQRVLEDVAAQATQEIPEFTPDPPSVVFVEMADFSLVFRVVVKLKQFVGYFGPIGELQHRIYARLEEEGIEIPFPTRTLHIKQESPKA